MAQSGSKTRALIVDGFSNHDWRKTTGFILDALAASGRFTVEVSTSPGEPDAAEWTSWHPDFAAYDVVIQNSNNIQQPELRWPGEVERDLESYVRSGGGLLIYHSANNAFPHWDEYDRMIGLGWRDADAGAALQLSADGHVRRVPSGEGDKTSHGPRQDTVVTRHTAHPINEGMPKRWLTPDIEVYTFARGPAEALTILSYGRHHATDTWWPLEWTVRYGEGRVYNSSFGHIWKTDEGIPDRVRCAGFQTSLIRAAEWTATGAVTWPIPSDFPAEDRIRLR
jgi:type 1 glutamine amidotransferase